MNETIADIAAELRRCPTNTVLGGIVSIICNRLADRIEAAAKREIPQPDPDWKTICEKCKDGEILPDNCEYFGEPNGCNSPLYGQHPIANGENEALRRALKVCITQMCDRCRAAESHEKNPVPCLYGCEALNKAKAALEGGAE